MIMATTTGMIITGMIMATPTRPIHMPIIRWGRAP